jgi:LemA protein
MEYMLIAAGIAVVGVGFAAMTSYNRLWALDSRCDKANADIDVQLKHRHSLIPNLVELVKGYMGHELQTLEVITNARQNALTAPTVEARQQVEAVLGKNLYRILVTAEQLPSLQANEHFRALRTELMDAENKIAASRRFLNLAVDEFNGSLSQFPNSLLAGFAHLTRRNFFDLGNDRPAIEEGPSIKF